MDVKISIIMPVYNVESFVGKAIESIQTQTFGDFEFLIVDDGTPDNSGKICDEYAAKDGRIKVFHKENGGAPSARNMAIDVARGKYMYFMDSDDWCEPSMLENMYNLAEKTAAQLVVSGYYIDTYYNDTEKYVQEQFVESVVYTSQLDFRRNAYRLFDMNLLYTPWNKLFLSAYILKNNLRFPQTFWDDFPFVLSFIRDVERVAVTSEKYYHFMRARAESETAKYRDNMYSKREEEHGWMLDLYEHYGTLDDDSREFLARRYIERIVGCVENITNKSCTLSPKEKRAEIKKMICSDRAVDACKIARPGSFMMKVILFPVKRHNAWLTYHQSRLISWVKRRNTKIFARLKAKR